VSGNFGAVGLRRLAARLQEAAEAGDLKLAAALAVDVRRVSARAWDLVVRRLAAA
jgi:hypothetical protein